MIFCLQYWLNLLTIKKYVYNIICLNACKSVIFFVILHHREVGFSLIYKVNIINNLNF